MPFYEPLYLNGWFDWNDDGDWDDPGEHAVGAMAGGLAVTDQGAFVIEVAPPAGSTCDVRSRFRLDWREGAGLLASTDNSLDATRGAAQFGEVEDYVGTEGNGLPPPWRCWAQDPQPIDVAFAPPASSVALRRGCVTPQPVLGLLGPPFGAPPSPFFPPAGQDAMRATLTFELDTDSDGTPDESLGLTGSIVVSRGDACDCAPFDPLDTLPDEVSGLTLGAPSRDTLSWPTQPLATGYVLLRGALDGPPVGAGASESCRPIFDVTAAEDLELPATGTGYWYLVGAEGACGPGPYAQATGGARSSPTCP